MRFVSQAGRRSKTAFVLLTLAAAALAFVGVSHVSLAQDEPSFPVPLQPPAAGNGQVIYQESCAPCHGLRGGGDGPTAAQLPNPATAFADPEVGRQAVPGEWFQVTKEGRMSLFMPPWKNRLSDEEIWDVVAYALTLHTSQAELARGQAVWTEQCATCHGDLGAGDGPQALAQGWPMVSLADLAYSSQHSLSDWFQVTNEGRGAMLAFGDQLSADDIWAAVTYARTFTFQPPAALTTVKGEGRIVGLVTNGTPGGDRVAGLTVTLHPFRNGEALAVQETTAGADGTFTFSELPTDPAFSYLLFATYKGVQFNSQLLRFADGAELPAALAVYEASPTPGDIRVDLAQWFIDQQQGALLVGELYRVTHDSDHVYAGGQEVAPGKRAVLQFDLPAGYTNLAADGGAIGERFIRTAEGLVDTQPLPPGQSQVLLRYFLPYRGTRAELAHAVRYPVGRFSVLANQALGATVEGLNAVGAQTVAGRTFDSYEAQNVPARQPISIQFRSLPRAAAGAAGRSTLVWAKSPALLFSLIGVVALAVGALLVLALVRPSSPAPSASRPRSQPQAERSAQRQRLLQAVADLDDRYVAGEIAEASYRSQRTALKRSLLAVSDPQQAAAPAAGGGQPPKKAPSA